MSNLAIKGVRGRSRGGKWPELPPMPARLQEDADMRAWNAQLQEAWHNLRGQLDLLEEDLRATITESNQ